MADGLAAAQAELRRRHFALLQTVLPEMMGRLTWPRARIEAHRTHRLSAALAHAAAHSPYHARHLHGFDAGAPWDAFAALPVMGKAELMAHWDEIVTVPGASRAGVEAHLRDTVDSQYVFGDNVLMASGGSGGSPGLFIYDFEALAINYASLSRTIVAALRQRFPPGTQMRTAAVGAGVSAHGSYVMARIFSDPSQPTLSLPLWETPERLFPALNDFRPDFMYANASYALSLAAGHDAGTLRIDPHVFFFGSESLEEPARAAVRAAWPKAHVFTTWGTTEGAVTFPCPLGDGFHVSDDEAIIEPLDEHGAPCPPGAWSHHILLTNLYNRALPLFRYRVDDVFEFATGPCACGLAFQKVRRVHGRNTERFRYGKLAIHAGMMELAVLEQPSIAEYQIVQTPGGVRIIYRAAAPADEARMRARVAGDLARLGLVDPDVTIERVAEMARTKVGKLARYVPLTTG